VLFAKYDQNNQVNGDEMDRGYSIHGVKGIHVGFWWENQKEGDHLEDLELGGRIILKWILDRMEWYGLN
jgi:hypothetical protein